MCNMARLSENVRMLMYQVAINKPKAARLRKLSGRQFLKSLNALHFKRMVTVR